MTKNHTTYLAITLIYLLLSSCSKKQAKEIEPEVPEIPGTKVTYNGFVQALFQTKCASCHAPGQSMSGLWTFNGYTSVTSNAARIKQVVLIGKTMPKGGSLTAAELASLQSWFDNGTPEQ